MTFLIAYFSENGVKMIIWCLNKWKTLFGWLQSFKQKKNDINTKYHGKT